ncbi:DUF2207 domain-containing protein [Flavobacteriaceae bacterium F89]|uniref:DUF2207 domain-containing protein n=1 Tax=Cerina litoralis TaxID=2874477 RepID=A0AAE3JNB6_9FLAO|nr:DUF2207 domain-containing protein [Cerina litoralis]MCG2459706.1 DUF2207 domain-containing protein [Cerina litoralis]
MKKILLLLTFLCAAAGKSQDDHSSVFPPDFTVTNYKVDIQIKKEGYFDVVENYDVDFNVGKHGIYRKILTEYDLVDSSGTSTKRKIKIDHIEVPGHKFDAPFNFVQKMEDYLTLKIGDKDITLTGPQHYEIRYRVHNAFLFGKDKIQFYWNIKPDGWDTYFQKIDFTIHAPEGIVLSEDNCFVYSGGRGNSERTEDFKLLYDGNTLSGVSRDGYVSHEGQSVTVLIDLPSNSVAEIKPFWPFWDKYGWVFLLGIMIVAFYRVWRKFGKDNRVIATTSYYPPENMDPAMVGFLIDDKQDTSDLISLIPYWGYKGFLRMEEIPKSGLFGKKDTKLIQLKPLPEGLPAYQVEIFEGLFGKGSGDDSTEILISSLKNKFYKTISSAGLQLKKDARPFYEAKSDKVQTITYVVLILATILLGAIGLFMWGPLALVAIVITCVVLMFMNKFMIKKNREGDRVLSDLKGFKQFIKVAEVNKLKMLLQDDPGYFESTMGYALAFGLFDKWAKKFESLNLPPPDWFVATGTSMNMHSFSKSFDSSFSDMKSTMVSAPSSSSSSGGGSSGGGFGGGGGGSW